jgi:hypothetical protein
LTHRKRSHKERRAIAAKGYAKKGGALGNAGVLGNTPGPLGGTKGVTEERELTGTRGLTADKKKGVIHDSDGSVTRGKGEREERLL